MGTINLPKSPVVFYAEKQGARVFTNSQMRENKGMKQVIDIIVKEETDRVIRHLKGKLPASLPQAEGKGGLKEKISGYILRNFLDMIDLYLPEDEDGKKTGSRLNSRNITELLISAGGAFQFNTGGPEKPSAAGLPGTNDLERQTNNMLRQKTEIGAFISCENNCSVIKCSFSDNAIKPKTVTDVNLSVNVPDSALINPFFRYVAAADCLIREAICGRLIESINIEIAGMENLGGGQESGESPAGEISGNDLVERIIGNENGTDDAAAHYGGNIDGNPA
ncbi:MAG: hypothetical protein FWH38_03685, partial [Treponema sp.]|nr:hypothetical protein [Treponema sp.]